MPVAADGHMVASIAQDYVNNCETRRHLLVQVQLDPRTELIALARQARRHTAAEQRESGWTLFFSEEYLVHDSYSRKSPCGPDRRTRIDSRAHE